MQRDRTPPKGGKSGGTKTTDDGLCELCRRLPVTPGKLTCEPCRLTIRRLQRSAQRKVFVYAIRCQDTGRVKIGISTAPEARFRTLQEACPTFLKLVGVVRGDRQKEREIHQRLIRHHVRMEWFAPCAEVDQCLKEVFG